MKLDIKGNHVSIKDMNIFQAWSDTKYIRTAWLCADKSVASPVQARLHNTETGTLRLYAVKTGSNTAKARSYTS